MMSSKNVSPFGPAVWPDIGNIYTNVLFYYIDLLLIGGGVKTSKINIRKGLIKFILERLQYISPLIKPG